MKTFDRKDVYSWANCEEAKQYIGKLGFYSNNFPTLKTKVKNCEPKELIAVNDYGIGCFNFDNTDSGYGLFLPLDKVKEVEEEKKWRAFNNHEELAKTLGIESKSLIGTKITWRNKGNGITVGQALIINVFSNKEKSCITLGLVNYSMEKLFYELELNKDGVWQPFGVEE